MTGHSQAADGHAPRTSPALRGESASAAVLVHDSPNVREEWLQTFLGSLAEGMSMQQSLDGISLMLASPVVVLDSAGRLAAQSGFWSDQGLATAQRTFAAHRWSALKSDPRFETSRETRPGSDEASLYVRCILRFHGKPWATAVFGFDESNLGETNLNFLGSLWDAFAVAYGRHFVWDQTAVDPVSTRLKTVLSTHSDRQQRTDACDVLGIVPSRRYFVVAISTHGESGAFDDGWRADTSKLRLSEIGREAKTILGADSVIGYAESRVFVVCESLRDLGVLAGKVLADGTGIVCGAARSYFREDLPIGRKEALEALACAELFQFPEGHAQIDQLGVERALLRMHEDGILADFCSQALGGLRAADDRSGTLLDTLDALLAHNLAKTRTADDLGVDRKTLHNRMQRIEAVLGPLGNPTRRLTLELALLARRRGLVG